MDCTNDGNLQGGASKSLRKATLKLSLLIVCCSYGAQYKLSDVLPASTAADYILVSSAGFALIPENTQSKSENSHGLFIREVSI